MKQNRHIDIHLAHTQGFCAGVSVALDIVDLALQHYGLPLYVRHAIVHNDYLVNHYLSWAFNLLKIWMKSPSVLGSF